MKTKLLKMVDAMRNDVANGGGKRIDPQNGCFKSLFDSCVLADRYNLKEVEMQTLNNLTPEEMKMIEFARNEGIDFYLIPDDRSEMFVCTRKGYKAIFICPKDLTNKANDRILAIAHELGHYMNLKYFFDFDVDEFQSFTYNDETLIREEVIAWQNAKVILETVGYNDWVAYVNEAIRALNTYISGGTEETVERMKMSCEYMVKRLEALTEPEPVH